METTILLFVQPAYNYNTQRIEYAEVLIREYNNLNNVPSILNFVKKNNIEEKFDFDVLRETLEVMSMYKDLDYPIGINLCPYTASVEGVAHKIIDEIDKYKVKHSDIIIEINEETDLDSKEVSDNINVLRSSGIKVALDDFGIKGANLSSLFRLNVDILKVDRAFIEPHCPEVEESQHTILRALGSLCHQLNLRHIVEGIETKKQLELIKESGYEVVQGYLYKKPVPFREYMANASNKNEFII